MCFPFAHIQDNIGIHSNPLCRAVPAVLLHTFGGGWG